MSIRARFTLLYNVILLVTLLAFGAALYGIQASSTLNSLKKDLIYSSDEVAINLVPMLLANPPGLGLTPLRTPKLLRVYPTLKLSRACASAKLCAC
jgi:hypothetical protein